jgi:hypothetical protein
MSQSHRDNAPAKFNLFRRRILVGGGLLLGGLAVAPKVPTVAANTSTTDFPNQFMELSSLLIAHRLDRDVGLRLAAALRIKDPAFAAHVIGLIDIAKKKNAKIVEDFFTDTPEGPLKEAALLIIAAWYLGVIVDDRAALSSDRCSPRRPRVTWLRSSHFRAPRRASINESSSGLI